MTDHPVTPPPELVEKLRNEAPHGIRDAGVTRELHLIAAAYRAGADQELKACLEWMKIHLHSGSSLSKQLRAARRPKPPSLAEEALKALDHLCVNHPKATDQEKTILRAIKRLQELEGND